MIKSISLFSLSALVLIAIGCRRENSESVDQDDIWANYALVYNKELDKTFARVTFKDKTKNGENLKLSPKFDLSVNNSSLDFSGTFVWYEKEFSGVLNQADFFFQDLDDNTFENSFTLTDSAVWDVQVDTLYKDSVVFTPWEGGALIEGEFVRLIIDGSADRDLTIITQDTLGAMGIYLTTTNLADLPKGAVSVYFERWRSFDFSFSPAGGEARTQYISTADTLVLN